MKNMLRLMVLVIPALLVGCKKTQYTAYALSSGQLIQFDTKDPGTITNTITLSGLDSSDSVNSIFFDPSGTLYCVTSNKELCSIDINSGTVSLVTATDTNLFTGTTNFETDVDSIGSIVVSYDPVNSLFRLFATDSAPDSFTNDNVNLRLTLDSTGATLSPVNPDGDTKLVFVDGDTNSGKNPELVAIAYTGPDGSSSTTTLYGIDTLTQSLVRIGDSEVSAPDSIDRGEVHTIGKLGISVSGTPSLAIEATNGDVFATFGTQSSLYSIDTGSGAANNIGQIGDGTYTVTSLAFGPSQ